MTSPVPAFSCKMEEVPVPSTVEENWIVAPRLGAAKEVMVLLFNKLTGALNVNSLSPDIVILAPILMAWALVPVKEKETIGQRVNITNRAIKDHASPSRQR